jgi:plastocyanin
MQPNTFTQPQPQNTVEQPVKKSHRGMIAMVIALVVVIAAGIFGYMWWQSQQDTAAASDTPAQVTITKNGFTPATIKVTKGQRVTFNNSDSQPHEIKPSDSTSPLSTVSQLGPGESFVVPFEDAGTFSYYDSLNTDLKGTIIVE